MSLCLSSMSSIYHPASMSTCIHLFLTWYTVTEKLIFFSTLLLNCFPRAFLNAPNSHPASTLLQPLFMWSRIIWNILYESLSPKIFDRISLFIRNMSCLSTLIHSTAITRHASWSCLVSHHCILYLQIMDTGPFFCFFLLVLGIHGKRTITKVFLCSLFFCLFNGCCGINQLHALCRCKCQWWCQTRCCCTRHTSKALELGRFNYKKTL